MVRQWIRLIECNYFEITMLMITLDSRIVVQSLVQLRNDEDFSWLGESMVRVELPKETRDFYKLIMEHIYLHIYGHVIVICSDKFHPYKHNV